MDKKVGKFTGTVSSGYPAFCQIEVEDYGTITTISFDHKDLADLAHLVSEMKKEAKRVLSEKDRDDV